jgi:hypothetical protein
LSGFIRDTESVMERQQNQEGLSLAREAAADFRRGEEAREQAETYYTAASSYTASADDRLGRAGSINANEVSAFETFLVEHLSVQNGRRVSTREAQEYWVGLTSTDMGRAEQRAVQTGFFESRLHAESFADPSGYEQPNGAGYAPLSFYTGRDGQGGEFERSTAEHAARFDAEPPIEGPHSIAVEDRYSEVVRRQGDVRDIVESSADDVAHRTAITNGEAHIQRYGLESYVEWVGGEDNARIVLGDARFNQFALEEAEKATEDQTLRSAK